MTAIIAGGESLSRPGLALLVIGVFYRLEAVNVVFSRDLDLIFCNANV